MTPPAPTALDSELERLLAAFRGRLRAMIQQRCPARLGLDVDDVEQEIRIRLWKALASERVIDHPASYLHRVALSVIVDLLRRRSARPDLDRAEALDEMQLGSQADRNTFDPLRHAEGAAAREKGTEAIKARA